MENVRQDTKQNTPAGALQGITVLDLSSVVLGPFTSQLLGDMGAEVIKVEAPEGDAVRPVGPKRSHGMSALFMGVNRNKRSIVLDLKGAGGREVFDRLLAKADVVVHSIRTEAAARLGLTHAELSKKNPRIIVCHLLGFGDDGPYAGRAAYDDNIQALTGLGMLQTFGDNREPSYVPTLIADKTVALYAANAVALALFARERTGQGQEVSIPMFETMASFTLLEHIWGHSFEPPLEGMGYSSIRSGTRRPFKTKDGYISFLPYSKDNLRSFFRVIGKEHLIDDPLYATTERTTVNFGAIRAVVEPELLERTADEWIEVLGKADLAATKLNSIEDLRDDPHLQAVGFWREEHHPSEGEVRLINIPVGFSATPGSIRRLAPLLGEHTLEILREQGYDQAQIERLLATGHVRALATNTP